MFDKELFDKICSLECSFDDLKDFFEGIENREFDTDTPFEKYYSFDRVKKAVDKYKSGEISCEYLRYWANAYNLILKGGFVSLASGEELIDRKQLAKEEISSLLDSISFFDDEYCDASDVDKYADLVKAYDLLISREDLRVFYSHTCEFSDDQTDLRILIVDDKNKKYTEAIRFSMTLPENISDAQLREDETLSLILETLTEQGYTYLFLKPYS